MKSQKRDPNKVTKSQLARLLDASRTTITRHLLSGDAPRAHRGLYDKTEALQFLRTHVATAGRSPELERLRIKRLELEIERVTHDLATAKGENVPKSVIMPALAALVAECQALLREEFEQELPPRYVGKTLIECQLMNQEAIDLLIRRLKSGGKKAADPGGTAASEKGGF